MQHWFRPQNQWEQSLLRMSYHLVTIGGGLSGLGLLLMGFSGLQQPVINPQVEISCIETNCQPIAYAIQRPRPTGTPPVVQFQPNTIKPVATRKNIAVTTLRDTVPLQVTKPRFTGIPSAVTDEMSSIKLRRAVLLARPTPTQEAEKLAPASNCPSLGEHYAVIPVEGSAIDHPDSEHADLNLALRGYVAANAPPELTFYDGASDPDAPQLSGLFTPARGANIRNTYQINQWQWDCNCRGEPIGDWGATMIGLATTAGEAVYIPTRQADIYRGQYRALVLYAAEQQLTIGYTRQDSVVVGYVVHLQGVCVEPHLLALYRAQNNANGWRKSRHLPALTNTQPVGTAIGDEIQVAIRDNGAFLDPRSQKDWWQR